MNFSDWLLKKFVEWEKTMTRRQSYSAFSRHLGIRQTTFSQWINGNGIPSYEKAVVLAEKLGNEVYDILGYARPIDPFPVWLNSALESARGKIREMGVSADSPEAETVIIEAMKAAGYRFISTNDNESAK